MTLVGQESDDDDALSVKVTTQDESIETLRRYFMQEENEGSPIAALQICSDFVQAQSVKRMRQVTLDNFFKH